MSSLSEILRDITLIFEGFDDSRREAKQLIKQIAQIDDVSFITNPDDTLSEQQILNIKDAASKRVQGVPLSRIMGKREFWGLEFALSAATLDPRPDTETLVEAALKFAKTNFNNKSHHRRGCDDGAPFRILDLGTGTGCVLIALLSELPSAVGYSVDYSFEATQTARLNAKSNNVGDRFHIIQGSWMEALKPYSFDLIVSNPPYIEESNIEDLMPEVKNHDPILALSGGESGLDCYEQIIFDLKTHLNPHAHAFLEIGKGQLESLTRLSEESSLSVCDSVADLSGILRVVEICRGDK